MSSKRKTGKTSLSDLRKYKEDKAARLQNLEVFISEIINQG
jgi:hypothetical protein